MLLTQYITLYWDKDCRGAPYSTIRNRMPKAYELPKAFLDYNPSLGYNTHFISLRQNKNGLDQRANQKESLPKHGNVQIGAMEILKQNDDYEIRYRYDWDKSSLGGHKANPGRHKYDPQTCMYKPLNVSAMTLRQNEYGRIIYNGRYVDYNNRTCHYEMAIINVINSSNNKMLLNAFMVNEPDKTYEQIAFLW